MEVSDKNIDSLSSPQKCRWVFFPSEAWSNGDPNSDCVAWFCDASGEPIFEYELSGPYAILPSQVGEGGDIVLPASLVTSLSHPIPLRQLKEFRGSLAYAIEDLLIDPPEVQHIAVGHRDDGGNVALHLVSKPLLGELVNRVENMGVPVDRVISEGSLLSGDPAQPELLLAGGNCVFRQGAEQIRLPVEHISLIDTYLNDKGIDRVGVAGAPSEKNFVYQYLSAKIEWEDISELSRWICRRLAEEERSPVNLLQGELTPRHHQLRLPRWWFGGMALSAALAALSIYFVVVGAIVNKEAQSTELAAWSRYQQFFPGEERAQGPLIDAIDESLELAAWSRYQQFFPGEERAQGPLIDAIDESFRSALSLFPNEQPVSLPELMRLMALAWRENGADGALIKSVNYNSTTGNAELSIEGLPVAGAESLQAFLRERGLTSELSSVAGDGSDTVVNLVVDISSGGN